MIPVVPDGWKAETVDLPAKLYDSLRNSFATRNGRSLFARGGKLWCWETMVYLVGYEDGAVFAGSCAVAHPNRFAAVALVGVCRTIIRVPRSPVTIGWCEPSAATTIKITMKLQAAFGCWVRPTCRPGRQWPISRRGRNQRYRADNPCGHCCKEALQHKCSGAAGAAFRKSTGIRFGFDLCDLLRAV